MKVSIYSPAWQTPRDVLERSIASIKAQTVPVHEIITVEDGDEVTANYAEQLGVTRWKHGSFRTPEITNLGLAASCNTALRGCTGDFLAKIDSDVELSPFWLEKAMRHFDNPDIVGVGGRMVETYCTDIPGRWRAVFMGQHWGTKVGSPPFLFGADCIFRVEALRKVGGWNDKYRKNYEDADLSFRLGQKHLVYEPQALARHLLRETWPDVLNHEWNWAHDPNDVGYGSIAEAAGKIAGNYGKAMDRCRFCMDTGDLTLMYPSWLGFWWKCLKDLEHVERLGNGDTRELRHAVVAEVLWWCDKTKLPLAVAHQVYKDMPGTLCNSDSPYLAEFRRYLPPADPVTLWCLETSVRALNAD